LDQVRAALRDAGARKKVERKIGLIQAVKTRARRHNKLIYEIAAGIRAGKRYGPASCCRMCQKALTDQVSIERGIGPEC
jgi:hypothetical protein